MGGRWNSRCEVCDLNSQTGGGSTVSATSMKCRYCCRSCCNSCFENYFPGQGPDAKFKEKQEYVCNECSADIEKQKHRPGGCGICDDLTHLPVDIMGAVTWVEAVAGETNPN